MRTRFAWLGSVLAAGSFAVGLGVVACSQTPTNVPVRTFERAQRMDYACLKLFAERPDSLEGAFDPIEPIGLRPEECAPVAAGGSGAGYAHHLFGFVTQTTRGEVAVVDLSAGTVVDLSQPTPGINFLPVGGVPTDVVTTPDGRMVFVASAEANKPAIYGIPTRRILGDTPGFPRDPERMSLASWPVCALPQRPGSLVVVPRGEAAAVDGGAASDAPEYDLVAVLPGDRQSSAKIVTIDVRPFRRGALPRDAQGRVDENARTTYDPSLAPDGRVLAPGHIEPCEIISAIELVGEESLPSSLAPSPRWDDGVKYVDGGADTTCARPVKEIGCGLGPCGCPDTPPTIAVPDGGLPQTGLIPAPTPAPDLDAGADAGCEEPVDAGGAELDLPALEPPRLTTVARADRILYIADEGVPLVHVVDLTDPAAPRELAPYVASSRSDPTRVVQIRDLAISPPTRDYRRYLYAVDRVEGSLVIFDATDAATSPRTPLERPHPEFDPFQPVDRVAFSAPVVAVSFARHDHPLAQQAGVRTPGARSGILCNPNRNLDADPASDPGYYYRASSTDVRDEVPLGPRRMRGIFGFATLGNGRVVVLDVDDWDAPCRRPTHLASLADLTSEDPATNAAANDGVAYPPGSSLAVAQPQLGDRNAYHAPHAAPLSVTNEAFFPMSSPHTLRSDVLVRDDESTGNQLPRISSTPTAYSNDAILPFVGPGSENTPAMSIRMSFEVPQAHINQDWSATFEGRLPGFAGISARMSTSDAYASLDLSQTQAGFCGKGIEDWAVGVSRADRIEAELARTIGQVSAEPLTRRIVDYVHLTEELLGASDPYWTLNDPEALSCWDGPLAGAGPAARHAACLDTFGTAEEASPARDFPILEAYDDRLVVGRFFTFPGASSREVVYKDPSNASVLKMARCCFHHQVKFDVRAAGAWVLVGRTPGSESGIGFLSHMTAGEGGRCVPSCDPSRALLNGRVPAVPVVPVLDESSRNGPLVARNPMFSVAIANPASGVMPARDTVYRFSTLGEFRALVVGIATGTTAVSPQSMRFIEPLGQLGVVDATSQGLVLVDLRSVTVARAPYF